MKEPLVTGAFSIAGKWVSLSLSLPQQVVWLVLTA